VGRQTGDRQARAWSAALAVNAQPYSLTTTLHLIPPDRACAETLLDGGRQLTRQVAVLRGIADENICHIRARNFKCSTRLLGRLPLRKVCSWHDSQVPRLACVIYQVQSRR